MKKDGDKSLMLREKFQQNNLWMIKIRIKKSNFIGNKGMVVKAVNYN